MKILELRFKNLNSLYGEWCIDFTDPAFVADGLFAITGPTGSGKTTILDALCLALYGQTPRLGKMTASDNEVMSRQTGECSAEVLFETAQGVFRAAWHQHRSHKKAGGALQAPKREIANEKGELLAEKLKEVQDKVDEVTGMGFDRFTRSILLAQGSFDAFLKANADERSPILEQITGTEIYTEISKGVHQRNSAESQKLKELQAALGGIPLLSEAELEQIEFDLKQLESEYKTQAEQRNAIQSALDWLALIETLGNDLRKNNEAQAELLNEQQAFEPEALRLASAKRAQPLEVAFAHLSNLRKGLTKNRKELNAASEKLPTLREALESGNKALSVEKEKRTQAETAYAELLPVLKQVRALDTQILEKQAAHATETKKTQRQKVSLETLQNKQNENQERLERLKLEATDAETYRQNHAADAALVGQLEAIFQSLELLRHKADEKNQAEIAVRTAEDSAQKTNEKAEEEKDSLQRVEEKRTEAERAHTDAAAQLSKMLDGKTASTWRNELESLRLKAELFSNHWKASETVASARAAMLEKNGQIKTATAELEAKQKEYALRNENLQLQQKIQSLEAHRAELTVGKPCPLCGAREHPYAVELPRPPADQNLDQLHQEISACFDRNASLKAQLEHQCSLQTAAESELQDIGGKLDGDLLAAEAATKQLPIVRERIEQIEKSEAVCVETKAAFETTKDELNQQTLRYEKARQAAETAAKELKTAEARRVELEKSWVQTQTSLLKSVETFGLESLDGAEDELTRRRDAWVHAEHQQRELQQTISTLQTTLTAQAGQLAEQEESVARQLDSLQDLKKQIDALHQERQTLFGDRRPDDVEQESLTSLKAAQKAVDQKLAVLTGAEQALKLAEQHFQSLEKAAQELQAETEAAEPAFAAKCTEAGFEDETAYYAARLDESERIRLEQRADELKERQTTLSALKQEKNDRLKIEKEKKRTELPKEELTEQHVKWVQTCDALLEKKGTLAGRIAENKKSTSLHQSKLTEIEKQSAECNRWGQLHELIGSADGKKFRNFAQGLTFELMVSHANRQLAKMSDRYLLIRDINQPLDLNVVDNYQAGEIRPVKNLSGGESFIVSLSLALGLSHMASKTIRVDSLFLDEGFGTLDEDALETALEALAELKQDGKLIGVISHVGALQERIGTQINVNTASGGKSRLSGTGVSARS